MQEIECVRGPGQGTLLDSYLKKLAKELGVDFKFSEKSQNLQNALMMIASPENLNDVKRLLEIRKEKIIIGMNSRKDFKMITELKSDYPKIFGFVDLSQEVEYNIPVLKNYLSLNFSKGTLPVEKLVDDLDKIYEFTKSELVKIKDLHDRFVKIRTDKLKGMTLSSKFMAGEKSGGEFFEIVQNDHEIIFIQAGSNSYILSSILLGELETLKEKAGVGNLELHLDNFLKTMDHHAAENHSELSYLVMSINLKTLVATFNIRGSAHLYYENEWISADEGMQIKLKPKQRLCIISEGAAKNWEQLSKKKMEKFFETNKEIETKDLINEFFFEVSRNKSGNFLIYDALMAVVDVEENKLYQV